MDIELDLDSLVAYAQEYFSEYERVAIAANGSATDLALIYAAASTLGFENVIVIFGDTGFEVESKKDVLIKACKLAQVELVHVPISVYDKPSSSNNPDYLHSESYKKQVFTEILHEAWLLGHSTVFDGCTKENYDTNGNFAQRLLGIVSPFEAYDD